MTDAFGVETVGSYLTFSRVKLNFKLLLVFAVPFCVTFNVKKNSAKPPPLTIDHYWAGGS